MGGRAPTGEHVADHLLGHLGIARVADEVGAGLAAPRRAPVEPAEGHVEPQDLPFLAVRAGDGGERDMGVGRLGRVVELDVVGLGAADRAFLLVDGQMLPAGQVVQVLLHDDVAAAGEVLVLVADQHGLGGLPALRVLGAVHEAEQVAGVVVGEAVGRVDDGGGAGEPPGDPAGELPADVHPGGPDVQEQVAGGGRGAVAGAGHLGERVQGGRAGAVEEPVPGVGADAGDAGEADVGGAEGDRVTEAREVGQQRADRVLTAGVDGEDQEDRGGGERGEDRLRGRWVGGPRLRLRLGGLWRHGRTPVSGA